MLRRPDAGRGCSWMKRWDQRIGGAKTAPSRPQTAPWFVKWFWGFYGVFMFAVFAGTYYLRGPGYLFPKHSPLVPYESTIHVAGLPLLAYGDTPRGIVAVGGRPVGVLAVGGIAVGLIAIGGVAIGGIALCGLSIGILALAGGALGWGGVGGGGVGQYAVWGVGFGGFALLGKRIAPGRF